MTTTYVELVSKLQEQGLTALKQVQDAHLAALTTARDVVTQIANAQVPTPASIPSSKGGWPSDTNDPIR